MKLLIDAGNTRIKWGVTLNDQWQAQGAVDHLNIASLSASWADWSISEAFAASVTKPQIRQQIESVTPCRVNWVETRAQALGVRNHYDNPAQMGVDRWLAVLAAHRLCSSDVVVACAGTALTIESLTRKGDYLGGLIMPGLGLMHRSLAHNTARLDHPLGKWAAFPQCTADALATGAIDAMAGAVEQARLRLQRHTGQSEVGIIVTGGDAPVLARYLATPARIVDNLVLMGLLEVAKQV